MSGSIEEEAANEPEYMAARVLLLGILFTEVLEPVCAAGGFHSRFFIIVLILFFPIIANFLSFNFQ